MQNIKKYFMTLALLLTAVTGAWAQEETLLTTITPTAKEQASYSTANVATVSFSYTAYGSSAYKDDWGWWGYGWIATVTAAEGYTITKCIFYDDANRTATDSEAPFVVETTEEDKTPRINGTPIDGGNMWSKGIKKIEVYGYKSEPEITEWSLTPDETGKTWTLAKMPASNIELQVEYEPTKVTMAANDNAMGTVEVAGQSKVEWTADTWKGWTSDIKEYTVDDITMTNSESAHIREYTSEDEYNNSLFFFVRKMVDDATVTFSTTGDPFSRIEFTMIGDYSERNPNIIPNDNWTFEGKSAVWEGEATKSLTLQSCSTNVSKITFFKGAIPDGVTINGDGTFTVAKTATVTLKATPAEGYKFLYWEDDQTNTNPVREVTIESGMADKTYKAVFAEITYNVTFVEGTNPDPENPEWTATPNPAKTKQTVTVTYSGSKKVIGVTVKKKGEAVENAYQKWDADQKKMVATEIPTTAITVENASTDVEWQAGTYVVEGNVTINGKITLSGDVNLIIKDGAKLTAQRISGASKNLSIYGQANQTGQLVVDNSGDDAITSIKTLEVHSAKVTATSSKNDRGGFYYTETINVYGGSVDAENTAEDGGYGIALKAGGFMNIFGGEVKAVGKGDNSRSNGINGGDPVEIGTVTVYGGKLWAENADDKALRYVNIQKGTGFTGKIETCNDNSAWAEYTDAETPTTKYVRVGY